MGNGASRGPSDSAKLVPVDGSTAARAYRSSCLIVSNALLSLPPGRPIVRRLEGEGACPTIPLHFPLPHPASLVRACARARARAPTPFPLRQPTSWFSYCCGLDRPARASPSRVYNIAAGVQLFIPRFYPRRLARDLQCDRESYIGNRENIRYREGERGREGER